MKKFNYSRICNYICVVLMLCLLVTQFLPFWECVDCENCEDGMVSLAEYFWNPREHKACANSMTQVYKDYFGDNIVDAKGKPFKFNASLIVIPTLIIFIAAVLTTFFGLRHGKKAIVAIIPLIAGIAGVYGYTSVLALQVGPNWQLHLGLCIAVLVISVISLTGLIPQAKAKFKELFYN